MGGESDDHGESAAGRVFGGEGAAHALDEPFGEREAEAEAAGVVGVAEALEGNEDVVDAVGWDSRAVVDDADLDDVV